MTVNQLIKKLAKFNPDGNAEVCTHYYESEQGYNMAINYLVLEEDENGKLVVVIHTHDDTY